MLREGSVRHLVITQRWITGPDVRYMTGSRNCTKTPKQPIYSKWEYVELRVCSKNQSPTSFHLGSVVYRYTLVLALFEKKPKESTSNVQ